MRIRFRVLLASALAAAALSASVVAVAPAASAAEAFVPWNWCGLHATTDALRLRSAPSTGAGTVLGLLDPGDRLTSGARSGGWVRVTLSGRSGRGLPDRTTGWVAARYLAAAQECRTFA
ncbi:SH3 domain-containing protein [Streptacidiphilus cavernicola]|uniref:SH3 domain-containing protein n=1 Tax=Streptacidiphilus cavernicola TaxID=3342716 RepID=A0ABV6VWC9_9ACTN